MKLKEKDVEIGYLYLTSANQYRAVLAMKGEFMIYAPSLEGTALLNLDSLKMPFENQPFKKCQIVTFAKKDYQSFDFNGTEAIKHKLNESQLAEVIAQCNAKSAIATLWTRQSVIPQGAAAKATLPLITAFDEAVDNPIDTCQN